MRRLALLAALGLALLAAAASPAGATDECKGFLVCVPVAGPWVVVPTAGGAEVQWQLTCPRGYVVGGLDAEVTDRAIDLAFLGTLGSPVGPGTSTSRTVVFTGSYAGTAPRAPTFRPHAGCLPAAGGGSRIPTSAAAFKPGKPTIRRARTVRVAPGTRTIAQRCAAGERLVSGWHAVGFGTPKAPGPALVGSVRTSQRIAGGRVVVSVRAGARAIVQVGAVCAGGNG